MVKKACLALQFIDAGFFVIFEVPAELRAKFRPLIDVNLERNSANFDVELTGLHVLVLAIAASIISDEAGRVIRRWFSRM